MDTTPTPPTPPPTPHASPEATQGTANVPEPKKYIRTFEGDMEAFKKGQTPNLTPLEKKPVPVVEEVKIEEKPVPTPAPTPIPVPVKPSVPIPNPVKSYSNDFSDRMKKTQSTTATVLAAEQDAKSGAPKVTSAKDTRVNIVYIVAGVILLILGMVGAYIAYTKYLVKVAPVILAPTVSTPIIVNEREKITGMTPDELLQAIKQSLTHPLAPNTVRLLYTDLATTSDDSVFTSLQLPAPGILIRNVNAAQSMAGVVSVGGAQTPFFILAVSSYGETFAGMLSWEKTMPQNLSDLFPPYPAPVVSTPVVSTSTATSTPKTATTKKVATSTKPVAVIIPAFHDEVINNHDARVYRDALGRAVLVYGYWNQKTLVIARDSAAFIEILNRLATSRTQ